MLYLARHPKAPLSLSVESLWLYSGYRPPHRFERVLPTGTLELVINLREDVLHCYDPQSFARIDTLRGPILAGPRESFLVIDTEQQYEIMGAHFRPGGAFAVLGVPADELCGTDVSLQEFWGDAATELRERLVAATDPERRLDILEHALLQHMHPVSVMHSAVRHALPRLELTTTPEKQHSLAADLGLSSRRFIEVFKTHVGVTPKSYSRIRRFQTALRSIHRRRQFDWTRIALDCGYYDQAHFIRDFRAFSGITPGAYERLQGEHLNHVPLAEQGQICPIPLS